MSAWARLRLVRLIGGAEPRHRAKNGEDPALLHLVATADPAMVRPGRVMNLGAIARPWRTETDDLFGKGWCVVVDRDGTPGTGNPALCHFIHEETARHVTDVHNEWLGQAP